MTTSLQQTRSPAVRIRDRALVLLAGSLAAALVWVVAVPVLGIDVTVPKSVGSKERIDLALGPVAFAPIFAGLAGWALLAVLERLTRRATLIWTIVAGLVFVLTLPYTSSSTVAEFAVLTLLHVVVAAVLIIGLPRTR